METKSGEEDGRRVQECLPFVKSARKGRDPWNPLVRARLNRNGRRRKRNERGRKEGMKPEVGHGRSAVKIGIYNKEVSER